MGKYDLDELVHYTSEKLAAYIETPREQRKAIRKARAMRREPWMVRWFGMIPMAIMQWLRRK